MEIGTYKFHKRDKRGRFAVRGLKMTRTRKVSGAIVLGIAALVGSYSLGEAYPLYNTLYAGNVYADELPVELMPKTAANRPHILKRIAQAESLDSHYCTKRHVAAGLCKRNEIGQVLIRRNDNGTEDIGRYQINLHFWGKQAGTLGFNLYDEAGNEAMAQWVYDNYGTGPWYLSKHNWNK